MSMVFLDTVGLIALWDKADQWHAGADAAFAELISQRRPFVTTSFILLECGNAAARRPYRNQANLLRDKLELRGELIFPTDADWKSAWAAYDRGEAAQAGIIDHISFVVMRRMGIIEVFTNDRHFQAAGFATLF